MVYVAAGEKAAGCSSKVKVEGQHKADMQEQNQVNMETLS